MYADNNKVELAKVKPNTPFNLLSGNLGVDDNIISLANATGLDTFEGLAVGAANTGYLLVNDEIISYDQVGVGSISVLARVLMVPQLLLTRQMIEHRSMS